MICVVIYPSSYQPLLHFFLGFLFYCLACLSSLKQLSTHRVVYNLELQGPWETLLMQTDISIVAFFHTKRLKPNNLYYDNVLKDGWMFRMQTSPDLIHSTEQRKIYSGIPWY